jgi:uncharacterized protein YeaO (DUF488 family)
LARSAGRFRLRASWRISFWDASTYIEVSAEPLSASAGRKTMAPQIETKRVYDLPSPEDGARILVDRLWPRGVGKDAAALDHWAKDVAPTPELRKWFGHKPERFDEFERRYRAELAHNPNIDALRDYAKRGRITLLYAAHDPRINNAHVLAAYLRKKWG